MDVAHVLLANIHPARNTVNTLEQNRHYTPLISTYFIVSKFVSASKCDIAREQNHTYIHTNKHTHFSETILRNQGFKKKTYHD